MLSILEQMLIAAVSDLNPEQHFHDCVALYSQLVPSDLFINGKIILYLVPL